VFQFQDLVLPLHEQIARMTEKVESQEAQIKTIEKEITKTKVSRLCLGLAIG
jgi:hypothetical protein